jgi:hypothetical protein
MSDVFVSYARKDIAVARRLTERLRAGGWTVFLDEQIRTGAEWSAVIEAEVRKACCVVVLFSPAAADSLWVRKEATIGLERGVLLPALLGLNEPPDGFNQVHASDLTGWTGGSELKGLKELVHAITMTCGGHESLMVRPRHLYIVVGRPKTWPALGAAVNVDCEFENTRGRTASIRWLEVRAAWPTGKTYTMPWSVPYDRVDPTEHRRRIEDEPTVELPPGQLVRGLQFQAPPFTRKTAWPAGRYRFDLEGWADHERGESPNLRTRFDVTVDDFAEQQVKWLQDAADATWVTMKASDDAAGVEVQLSGVLAGLPPD